MKRRLTKTILYRISTIGLVQFIYWAIFGTVELKFVIITVAAQTIWYYAYDWLWERKTICPKCKGKGYYYEGDVDIIDVDSDSLFAGLVVCECRKKEVENAKT